MADPSPFPRTSLLLAAFRVLSVVHKFKSRLQEKVQQKHKSTHPFGVSYQRLRLRAISDLEKCAPSSRLTEIDEPRSATEHHDHGRWINALLKDLDDHTSQCSLSVTRSAADDKLFLDHSEDNLLHNLAQQVTLRDAAYIFDSCTFLIGKLEAVQSTKTKDWAELDAECKRLKDEAYVANLLHLLRRLQYVLFQALVHRSITRLDEFAVQWHTYWQQKKKLGADWYTEWPSGQRPLGTTWPWNIRPSLLVLWGVCWMFYNSQSHSDSEGRWAAQQRLPDSATWEQVEQAYNVSAAFPDSLHTSVVGQTIVGSSLDFLSPQTLTTAPPMPSATSPQYLSVSAQPQSPYYLAPREPLPQDYDDDYRITPVANTVYYSPTFQVNTQRQYRVPYQGGFESPVPSWSSPPGGDIPGVYTPTYSNTSDVDFGHNQPSFPPYLPTANNPTVDITGIERSNNNTSFDDTFFPNPSVALPLGLDFTGNQAMGTAHLPSPTPERGQPSSVDTPTAMPEGGPGDQVTTPNSDGCRTLSTPRNPVRDAEGNYPCDHLRCQERSTKFRRRCEWIRHMDRHDRPFKCPEPNCDRAQGFTYMGGLLRHQREVHRTNQSSHSHSEFYCDRSDCSRSRSGMRPFSRAENLKEHIRRRHDTESANRGGFGHHNTTSISVVPVTAVRDSAPKRKRSSSAKADTECSTSENDNDATEYQLKEVKRLRRSIAERDDRIRELENKLAAAVQQDPTMVSLPTT